MRKLELVEKITIVLGVGFSVLFVLFLVVAQLPSWWKWIIFERTPMTWFESLLLYTCALISFGCTTFSFLERENKRTTLWALLGFAFFYLMLDERFAIHERIRDNILAPHNIKLPIFFWTSAGDFILLLYLVAGILLLPKFLALFKVRKSAYRLFIIGLCVSIVAVLMDSFNVKKMSIEFQRLEQFIEEILETAGMLFFLNALFLVFTHYIKKRFGWGEEH